VCHESQQDNKRPADSEHFSVPPIHTRHMKSNSASTSGEEREDMIPISWRMKRRHLETKHEDASYEVKPKVYPSTSSCSQQEFGEATRDSASVVEQQGSSGQRFASDDKPPGYWHTY
jgi:hypothetical protein